MLEGKGNKSCFSKPGLVGFLLSKVGEGNGSQATVDFMGSLIGRLHGWFGQGLNHGEENALCTCLELLISLN